jgi:RHS repeat-associated protein
LVENQRVTDYDERYKFTGKERDWETGYDFFGARSYASVLSIWLSPDPLSDKYPEISPYAYAAWNPVKYIDPDGRKCTLSVNYKTNTITISAKYYALKGDSRYAQKAANFWNNQKGLTYTAKDGTNYSVQFALDVYSTNNPTESAKFDGNTFEIVKSLGCDEKGNLITGQVPSKTNCHISVIDSRKETLTGAHEMGHTLMNLQGGKDAEHSTTGVMTKYGNTEGRTASVSQETVNKIVESNGFNQKTQTLWQRIKSWFE